MLALPETAMPERPVQFMRPVCLPTLEISDIHPLKQLACALCGVGLVLAAMGVWVMPATPGDSAMQLVKLLVSMVMLFVGLLCLRAMRDGAAGPEIELDTNARELRLVMVDRRGARRNKAVYKVEDLSELTLRDRYLIARDGRGRKLLSVPVANRATEKTICNALSAMI